MNICKNGWQYNLPKHVHVERCSEERFGMGVCNWYSEAQVWGMWSASWNQRLIENQQANEQEGQEQRKMWYVLSVEGASGGRATKHATNVLMRGRS